MKLKHNETECNARLAAIGDALYFIGGKWKLRIIIALKGGGKRFNELQRTVTGISARVLSSELRELELHGFLKRNILTQAAVVVEYEATEYSATLDEVLMALSDWGARHREKIRGEMKHQGGFNCGHQAVAKPPLLKQDYC